MEKLTSLREAIQAIPHGVLVGLGGNTLNRAPMGAVFELARQQKRGLSLVKTAGAMDIDLLCLADCVARVDAGFVSYETQLGLARHYRRSVEKGLVNANEHACYTVICALRAASYGAPFLPVRGLNQGDLLRVNPCFRRITDPFSGDPVTLVQAIRPDWSILHVHKADRHGNAAIHGPQYEDVLLSRASRHLLITAEELVEEGYFRTGQQTADIPGFLVSAVVHMPRGAAPCACDGCYPADVEQIRSFQSLTNRAELISWLKRGDAHG